MSLPTNFIMVKQIFSHIEQKESWIKKLIIQEFEMWELKYLYIMLVRMWWNSLKNYCQHKKKITIIILDGLEAWKQFYEIIAKYYRY